MKNTKYFFILLMFLVFVLPRQSAFSQKFAVKTNLLYGAVAYTPNLGFEARIAKQFTFGISGGWNPFPVNRNGFGENNKKLKHWQVSPEFRYYFCRILFKHFIGIHGFYTQYNIGGYDIPLLFPERSKDFRHEGTMVGAGVSYGYHLLLDKRWSMEFDIGLGYGYMVYENFECAECGYSLGKIKRNYFGLTKLGVTLMYLIK